MFRRGGPSGRVRTSIDAPRSPPSPLGMSGSHSARDERERGRGGNGLLSRLMNVGGRRKGKGGRDEDFGTTGPLGPRDVNPEMAARTTTAAQASAQRENAASGRRWRVGRASQEEHVFGEAATHAPGTTPVGEVPGGGKTGSQILLEFLHHINPATSGLAKMLINRTPITDNASGYRYVVNQGTEQSDLAIVLRDLTDGRLYRVGVRLVAAPWTTLLFGDSFTPATGKKRQLHEFVYRRTTCTCIICLINLRRAEEILEKSSGTRVSETSSTATLKRTSPESAMANFTLLYAMPVVEELLRIGGERQSRELDIGQLVRLQSRNTAKLIFTEEVRELFGNLAYTGPLSHEDLYRKVTTIGVNYFLYNKGKKSRRVYLQGDLVQVPLELGVVKCGAHAMYLKEIGSTYVMYKPQIMSIYIGTIVLEGNSLGSFISTGIKFYVGFGEERGCVPVYPGKRPNGPARRVGVNEVLLHHHQVGDFEVTLS